jgi:SAM-dependent methyltransferase
MTASRNPKTFSICLLHPPTAQSKLLFGRVFLTARSQGRWRIFRRGDSVKTRRSACVVLLVALATAPLFGQAARRDPDVPFVPSPEDVVGGMLKLAGVKPGDVVYDLGSGDGRIAIMASKMGARAVGVDINPERIKEANENARKNGAKNVKFVEGDLFEADIKDATVVTLYLLPSVNLKLKPKLLRDLKPGTRIVSHSFDMGDWKPEKEATIDGRRIYLWTVPAK